MTKRNFFILVVVLSVLLLAGCTALAAAPAPTAEPTPPPPPTTAPISAAVVGYAERLSAGDLQGTLAFFDDNARMYLFGLPPTGTELYDGKEQIKAMLEENIANHFKMEVEVLDVDEDVVTARTTTWHDFTREIGVAPLEAIAVYVIKDGKITTEAWHVSAESLAKIKSALGEMPPEPPAQAETPVSEIKVTIAGGTCTYEGPLALQAGPVAVTLDVQDQDRDSYLLLFVTLDPGKEFTDLMAATIGDQPSWAHIVALPNEKKPGESTHFNVRMREGPVYGICMSEPPELAIGAIGPFTIVE